MLNCWTYGMYQLSRKLRYVKTKAYSDRTVSTNVVPDDAISGGSESLGHQSGPKIATSVGESQLDTFPLRDSRKCATPSRHTARAWTTWMQQLRPTCKLTTAIHSARIFPLPFQNLKFESIELIKFIKVKKHVKRRKLQNWYYEIGSSANRYQIVWILIKFRKF